MLPVNPYYFLVISHPEYMKVDGFEIEFPIYCYVAAKLTSRESGQEICEGQALDFTWTNVTCWIHCWPNRLNDRKWIIDEGDRLAMLTEWGSRKVFNLHLTVWAFTGSLTVQPRKTSDCDSLQITRCALWVVALRPSYASITSYSCFDANGRC